MPSLDTLNVAGPWTDKGIFGHRAIFLKRIYKVEIPQCLLAHLAPRPNNGLQHRCDIPANLGDLALFWRVKQWRDGVIPAMLVKRTRKEQ